MDKNKKCECGCIQVMPCEINNTDKKDEKILCIPLKIKSLIAQEKPTIKGDQYNLKPQEVICFVTDEIKLSEHELGLIFEKNKLSIKGLMVLCSKLVEPGYEGYLTGTVVNISKNTVPLRTDMVILECLKLSSSNALPAFSSHKQKKFIDKEDSMREMINRFPKTFMDIDTIQNSMNKEIRVRFWALVGYCASAAAIVLALFNAFIYFNDNSRYENLQKLIQDFEKTDNLQSNILNWKDFKKLQEDVKVLKDEKKSK